MSATLPVTSPASQPSEVRKQKKTNQGFRPDLEGARGVAVILVVLFHAGVAQIPGGYVGVDVFYVLSGFFITGLLYKEILTHGTISFANFYSRRFRRLIPVATLILFITGLLGWFILSPLLLPGLGWDTLAATWQLSNVRFTAQATDYLSAETSPSPLLHFWSLAVEEQFYLFWPLLLLLVTRRSKKNSDNDLPSKGWVFGRIATAFIILIGLSFALSVWLTPLNEPFAFYMLPTRAWELGIGGLLAIAIVGISKIPTFIRALLGWAGIAGIIYASLEYNAETSFPGYAAALPVLATAALIASVSATGGPKHLLATKPMRALGRWSYSLYLWHWPILVLAGAAITSFTGVEVPVWLNLTLMVGATLLAAITYKYVENPIRVNPQLVKSNVKTFTLIMWCILVGTAIALALIARPISFVGPGIGGKSILVVPKSTSAIVAAVEAGLEPHAVPNNLVPNLSKVLTDKPAVYDDGCHLEYDGSDLLPCIYGDKNGSKTVWIVGDSHAAQWFPVIEKIAITNNWKLVSHTKSACPLVDENIPHPLNEATVYSACKDFNDKVLKQLETAKPDLIIASSTVPLIIDRLDSYTNRLNELKGLSSNLLVLGDTPHHKEDIPVCVAAHVGDVTACATEIKFAEWDGQSKAVDAAMKKANFNYERVLPWLCTTQACPAIADNVLLSRDRSHITTQASLWLQAYMQPVVENAMKIANEQEIVVP